MCVDFVIQISCMDTICININCIMISIINGVSDNTTVPIHSHFPNVCRCIFITIFLIFFNGVLRARAFAYVCKPLVCLIQFGGGGVNVIGGFEVEVGFRIGNIR